MKHILAIIIALGLAVQGIAANHPTAGRVVDSEGKAIEYATVVLLDGTKQVAGMATDSEGRFSLSVAAGDYTLTVQYLGYDTHTARITIPAAGNDLGDITLKASATAIDDVVVTAQLIRREADRFVMDIANAPSLSGKDGIELLERAPSVWVDNEKISVNGKSDPKVYINGREVRMTGEQLLSYLRSLHAEEIQRIEVVPTTGADYDADTQSGAIHIILKKRRENGMNGSIGTATQVAYGNAANNSWLNINGHTGKVDIYGGLWSYYNNSHRDRSHEKTTYPNSQSTLESHSQLPNTNFNGGGNVGAIYEINPKHSIGGQFDYHHTDWDITTDTWTDFMNPEGLTRTDSRFVSKEYGHNYTATFNYITKLDTLGSTFKILADFTERTNNNGNDNNSTVTVSDLTRDSLYRNMNTSRYRVTTATAALEKKFSPKWGLKAGLKYTRNDMRDDALYEYEKGGAWLVDASQTLDLDYSEQIGAAYAIVSASLGRVNFVAGIRGEYTHTAGRDVEQDYLSLFPNANISYALTKDGSYSLTAQYARTIQRPSFYTLSPARNQISDYMYQTGNPDLGPQYNNSLSLTFVAKYKYSLSLGMNIRTDRIQQAIFPDKANPDILVIMHENYDTMKDYWASLNLPFQLTKWWSLNLNGYYQYTGQRVFATDPVRYSHMVNIYASTTFTLPKQFYIDLSGYYQSRAEMGNVAVLPQYGINASLKKNFSDKFTVTLAARNLVPQTQKIESWGEGFNRRIEMAQSWSRLSWTLQLNYNFKSGKTFRNKSVESGSAEDKSRL